jgi:F-type H+-transporting ATPase subunit b
MDIEWPIVAFEVLNFAVLVVLLRRFLFRPVQRALIARRDEIERERVEVEGREQAAVRRQSEYEERRGALEAEADERLEVALSEGRGRAEALVAEARDQARHLVTAAELQVAAARRRALEQLRVEVLRLSAEAAERVVPELEAPAIARAQARRAAHRLAAAFVDGRVAGQVEAAVGNDEDREPIAEEVRAVLGPAVALELTVDPSIVAGVRLRAAGHEVEASVSASLRRWYEERMDEPAWYEEDA